MNIAALTILLATSILVLGLTSYFFAKVLVKSQVAEPGSYQVNEKEAERHPPPKG